MVKKTFVIENKVQKLQDLIKNMIEEKDGIITSSSQGNINWTYIYGKQNLNCKTILRKNEVETEVINLDGVYYGEGFVVNKFFNSLSEIVKIREKEFPQENKVKKIYSESGFSNNQKSWSLNPIEKTVLVSVAVILFLIFTFTGDKSDSILNSNPKYFTTSGKMASYTEDSMQSLVNCSVHKDYNCINQLIYSGEVFELPAGLEVYVVKSSLSGKVKIRLKGETREIWTIIEAIKSE